MEHVFTNSNNEEFIFVSMAACFWKPIAKAITYLGQSRPPGWGSTALIGMTGTRP